MLVSYSNKFIYIKAIKVSGTSVQVALAANCTGNKDIVTPVAHSKVETPNYSPKNYLYTDGKIKYDSHHGPEYIKTMLGKKIWNDFTKIVIVRNPWAAFASRYKAWAKSYGKDFKTKYPNLNEWVKTHGIYSNKEYYFWPDGKDTCNVYLQQEDISNQYKKFCSDYGLIHKELPRLKISTDIRHYSSFIDTKLERLITKQCKQEINKFNYIFERKEEYNPTPWK